MVLLFKKKTIIIFKGEKGLLNYVIERLKLRGTCVIVVAEGAGLYSGIIENKYQSNEGVVLMDVLPLSLGVELADGSYSIIIPKNKF